MGGFFVPGQPQTQNIAASAVHGGEFSLPTPDSLSHSFGFPSGNHIQNNHAHSQFAPYPAPSSPYYPYNSVPPPRPGSPTGLGISPSDVETLGTISIGNGTVNNLNMSTAPAGTPTSIHPSNLPANSNGILPSAPLSRSISSSMSGKTVTAPNGSITGTKQLDPGTDNHLSEKKKRRRESHNAVERRRRDNINERIGELAGLIPGVLFECDVGIGDELFGMNLLGESGMHVLPSDGMDGLPDLPEECVGVGTLKKDPTEDGEEVIQGQGTTGNGNGTHASSSLSANGTIPTNGTTSTMSGEQTTIKANKGMILRKSVEYIRYLQQLVSIQASRGRDLEERNRTLEQQLAALQGSLISMSGEQGRSTWTLRMSTSEQGRITSDLPRDTTKWIIEKDWNV
ncbi:HLH-domain-containing protein [Scleroderma citrinum]